MDAFYENLPKKRMGAGVLIFNDKDEILFVHPTYKPVWEIPGGSVEINESPRMACIRELGEELAFPVPVGQLLCVGYGEGDHTKTERLHFIFDGGRIAPEGIQKIRVPKEELSGFTFTTLEKAAPHLTIALKEKIQHALQVRKEGGDRYLEHRD